MEFVVFSGCFGILLAIVELCVKKYYRHKMKFKEHDVVQTLEYFENDECIIHKNAIGTIVSVLKDNNFTIEFNDGVLANMKADQIEKYDKSTV